MKISSDSIGAFEAKNRLSELLERVGHGSEFVITKHDRPVARLIPVTEDVNVLRAKATQELKRLRERYSLSGLSVRELISEGRA